jgi:CheY-like chemotaxis protein
MAKSRSDSEKAHSELSEAESASEKPAEAAEGSSPGPSSSSAQSSWPSPEELEEIPLQPRLVGTRLDASRGNRLKKPLRNHHLLVVDDNHENQFFLTTLLRRAGATVEVAGDGVEALHKSLRGTFDAILMDLQMPQLDGFRATAILRERGYTRPIIAVTALTQPEDRSRCLESGCTDYIAKPVDPAFLVKTLGHHLGTVPRH